MSPNEAGTSEGQASIQELADYSKVLRKIDSLKEEFRRSYTFGPQIKVEGSSKFETNYVASPHSSLIPVFINDSCTLVLEFESIQEEGAD